MLAHVPMIGGPFDGQAVPVQVGAVGPCYSVIQFRPEGVFRFDYLLVGESHTVRYEYVEPPRKR